MKKKSKSNLRNVKLTVEYDGTAYFGWQLQDGKPTIQGEIERALLEIVGKRTVLIGSGRTDAGVHAVGQVANFLTSSRIPAGKWPLAINAHLPEDIRILKAEDVGPTFHSQFGAKRKTYRYTILNRDVAAALDRNRTHLVRRALNAEAMAEGAKVLVGTHDFRAFGSEMSDKERTIRTIERADVVRAGDRIEFTFTGSGFLYNQIRAMVGTLLEVGFEKHPPEWIGQILALKDRKLAGANVSAKGLCLLSVEYPVEAVNS